MLTTCIRNSILVSRTSSASLFLILLAESSSKCCKVNFSWRGREKFFWSQLEALLNWSQVIYFPLIVRHLDLPVMLLFSILLRIFLILCYNEFLKREFKKMKKLSEKVHVIKFSYIKQISIKLRTDHLQMSATINPKHSSNY